MRKIVAGLSISLDGVIEDADQWMGPWFSPQLGQAIGSSAKSGCGSRRHLVQRFPAPAGSPGAGMLPAQRRLEVPAGAEATAVRIKLSPGDPAPGRR